MILARASSVPSAEKASSVPMMGILCLSEHDAFATELLNHLHRYSIDHGLQMSVRIVRDFGEGTLAVIRQMEAQGCKAIIVPWARQGDYSEALWSLKKSSLIPIVTPDIYEKRGPGGTELGLLDMLRMELAYRYFLEMGRKNIAFFSPNEPRNTTISRRLFIYTRLANEAGMGTRVYLASSSPEEVLKCLDQWAPFYQEDGGLGVICYDDACALRFIAGAHKHGLAIPEKLGVIGFNNIALGKMIDPPLTTIEFGYERLAKDLVEHAIARINRQEPVITLVPGERMIVRESCGGRLRLGEKAQALADRLSLDIARKYGVPARTDSDGGESVEA